jgi:hypothetical protein
VDGSTTGNSPATTRGVGTGEDLGEKTRQVSLVCQRRWLGNGLAGRLMHGDGLEKTVHDDFSILEFIFLLTFQAGEKIK